MRITATPIPAWRHRPWAALALGSILALVVAIGIQWPLFERNSVEEPSTPVVTDGPARPRQPEMPPPLPGTDSSVAAGPQHLMLTGTHVARDPRDSLAFIGVDPKNPQTYALNALLVNGTRVHAIARDHVLLERAGQIEKLPIGGAWADTPDAVKRLTRIAAPAEAPLPEPSQEQLTEGLAISPVYSEGGVFAGYRLAPGRHGSVFTRWGLMPGDQLVAVENAPLIDVDTAAQMLGLLGTGTTLQATVLRNGARVPLVLDGGAIAEEKARANAPPVDLALTP